MTYIDTSDTGQGAKLNNQDILGCLFLCLKKSYIKDFKKIIFDHIIYFFLQLLSSRTPPAHSSTSIHNSALSFFGFI